MPGFYDSPVLVERFLASVAAGNISQPFMAPCDLEVIGMVLQLGTAPGAGDGVAVNVSNSPTSQLATVSAYNLWTTANRPTILGTATSTPAISTSTTVIKNVPYALNYPLPGPSGTVGYATAQSTSTTTETPVTAPPTAAVYQLGALVAPDNTYTDFNGVTLSPAAIVHAGDVLTFAVVAAGASVSVGAAANLEIVLYCRKR